LAVLAVTPAQAHCFRIWHYHTPQRCYAERIVYQARLRPPSVRTSIPVRPVTKEQSAITLPGLEALDWGYADYYGVRVDRLRGIAELRALSDGQR
jgi:hypothetical protein